MSTNNDKSLVYVGTYTYGDSKGIYSFEFDHTSHKVSNLQPVATLAHPTYVITCKEKNLLYAVLKQQDFGGVKAFKINNDSTLTELNTVLDEGKSPCHLSFDKDYKYVFAGNYHEATITVLPIKEDGTLAAPTSVIRHTGDGSGIVADRQEKPHVHYCYLTPNEKHLAAVDLGRDNITFYPFDKNTGALDEHNKKVIQSEPGSGPRHLIFHNEFKFFYVINELNANVDVYTYEDHELTITKPQTINSLPKDYEGHNLGAAIRISPNGKFLYTSNRGSDTISIFAIDSSSGLLTFVDYISTFGEGPRDFSFDPSGNFLIAANQNTNSIIIYKANADTGLLEKLECDLNVSNPVCISVINN